MKKFPIILLFLLFYIFDPNDYILAQELDFPSQKLPPDINCGQDFFKCLVFFFDKILKVVTTLALALSAIFIGWAGILYITKGSSGEKGKEIHQKIVWAAVGLIVALTAYAFVKMLEAWIGNVKI